jgi:arabinose-5-phosphate isomerase
MTNQPIKTKPDALAVDALKIMQKGPRHIMVLPVIDDNNEVIGMIRLHDIVKAGIK